jgi:hypothetical protein
MIERKDRPPSGVEHRSQTERVNVLRTHVVARRWAPDGTAGADLRPLGCSELRLWVVWSLVLAGAVCLVLPRAAQQR